MCRQHARGMFYMLCNVELMGQFLQLPSAARSILWVLQARYPLHKSCTTMTSYYDCDVLETVILLEGHAVVTC